MKIAVLLALLTLLVFVSCRLEAPVTYRSFLAKLGTSRRYQQSSLLDELDISIPVRVRCYSAPHEGRP